MPAACHNKELIAKSTEQHFSAQHAELQTCRDACCYGDLHAQSLLESFCVCHYVICVSLRPQGPRSDMIQQYYMQCSWPICVRVAEASFVLFACRAASTVLPSRTTPGMKAAIPYTHSQIYTCCQSLPMQCP